MKNNLICLLIVAFCSIIYSCDTLSADLNPIRYNEFRPEFRPVYHKPIPHHIVRHHAFARPHKFH